WFGRTLADLENVALRVVPVARPEPAALPFVIGWLDGPAERPRRVTRLGDAGSPSEIGSTGLIATAGVGARIMSGVIGWPDDAVRKRKESASDVGRLPAPGRDLGVAAAPPPPDCPTSVNPGGAAWN